MAYKSILMTADGDSAMVQNGKRVKIIDKRSPYWAKIEKKLASVSLSPLEIIKIKTHRIETVSDDWDLTGFRRGYMKCELCGHDPITNIFTITNKVNSGKLDIGSECAVNYVGIDLVKAVMKEVNGRVEKIKNEAVYEAEMEFCRTLAAVKIPAEMTQYVPWDKRDAEYEKRRSEYYTLNTNQRFARGLLWKLENGRHINPKADYDLDKVRSYALGLVTTVLNAVVCKAAFVENAIA